jgi:hypothetical protein
MSNPPQPATLRHPAAAIALAAALVTLVYVARWLLVPVYDYDTTVALLVPLRYTGYALQMAHAPLLPTVLTLLSPLTGPRAGLIVVCGVALFALLLMLGSAAKRSTGSTPAALITVGLLALAFGFRDVSRLADDNLLPLPFLLGSLLAAAAQGRRAPLWSGILCGAAVAGHLPLVVLVPVPLLLCYGTRRPGSVADGLRAVALFVAGLAGALAAAHALSQLVFLSAPPGVVRDEAASVSYTDNSRWFLFAAPRSGSELLAWGGTWALMALRCALPLPAVLLPGAGGDALLLAASLVAGGIWSGLLLTACIYGLRHGPAQERRLSAGALAGAGLIAAFAAVYEPGSLERWVTGLPLLGLATARGLADLLAALRPRVRQAATRAMGALLCVALLLLVPGPAALGHLEAGMRANARATPPEALLLVRQVGGCMLSYFRPGPTVFVDADGSPLSWIAMEHGTVRGYDSVEPTDASALAAMVRDALAAGRTVLVGESLWADSGVAPILGPTEPWPEGGGGLRRLLPRR